MSTKETRAERTFVSPLIIPYQVEEDIPKISPAMVGLGIVGPRRTNHVSEDPFVDVEVLEVEGGKGT